MDYVIHTHKLVLLIENVLFAKQKIWVIGSPVFLSHPG